MGGRFAKHSQYYKTMRWYGILMLITAAVLWLAGSCYHIIVGLLFAVIPLLAGLLTLGVADPIERRAQRTPPAVFRPQVFCRYLVACAGGLAVVGLVCALLSKSGLAVGAAALGAIPLVAFVGLAATTPQRTIHLGAGLGDLEMIEQELKKNLGRVSSEDLYGRTALHYAACKGQQDAIELLLSKGAALAAQDYAGRTPLHWAARQGHEKAVELLLGHKADATIRDEDGKTPLDLAREAGHEDIARLLEQHEAGE